MLGPDMSLYHSVDMEQLEALTPYSYYYENVFSLEDLFLFRAVYNFYLGEYDAALTDYAHCQSIKLESDGKHKGNNVAGAMASGRESLMHYSRGSTPLLSMNSSKTDLSDVGLCSLNIHETTYNKLLCHLFKRDSAKALEKVNELISTAPGKYQRHFFLIRGILLEERGDKEKAAKDFAKYEKADPKGYQMYIKDAKDMSFEPFPVKSRLCSRFEALKYTPSTRSNKLLLKPSFSMPFIKPPNMIPNIDEDQI